MKPDTLRRSKPNSMKPDTFLLKLCARCLGATDTLVKSAHNREKLGKALYDLFLPVNAKGKTYTELAIYRQPLQENPGNVELLANASPEIAAKLCPAILWLFGDAEHIGDIYQIAGSTVAHCGADQTGTRRCTERRSERSWPTCEPLSRSPTGC